jgi:hypothetical protein
MTTEIARGGEFAQFMSNHLLRNVHRHVPASIVYGDGMPDKLRKDRRIPRPRPEDLALSPTPVHIFDPRQELRINIRPLFD